MGKILNQIHLGSNIEDSPAIFMILSSLLVEEERFLRLVANDTNCFIKIKAAFIQNRVE